MVTYGFFNSVSGDRKYDADQMSEYFKGLIGNGVYENVGNALAVQADSGMKIKVLDGRGVIKCKWLDNDAALSLTLNGSHATLPRKTAIVMRLDAVNRKMEIAMKDGTPASSPSKPALTRTESVYELCLAWITVPAAAVSISQSNIEDARSTSDCGWITGLVTQLDISNLYSQWVDLFNQYYQEQMENFEDWFSDLAGELRVQTYLHQYIMSVTRTSYSQSTNYRFEADGYRFNGSDIFNVYINGLRADPNTDYTVGITTSNITFSIPNVKEAGNVIMIEAIKSKIGFNCLGVTGQVNFIDDLGRMIRV